MAQMLVTTPSSTLMRSKPSITWDSTMPETESVVMVLFRLGGSSLRYVVMLLFSTSMAMASVLPDEKALAR